MYNASCCKARCRRRSLRRRTLAHGRRQHAKWDRTLLPAVGSAKQGAATTLWRRAGRGPLAQHNQGKHLACHIPFGKRRAQDKPKDAMLQGRFASMPGTPRLLRRRLPQARVASLDELLSTVRWVFSAEGNLLAQQAGRQRRRSTCCVGRLLAAKANFEYHA